MVRRPANLAQLARELASLTPEEYALVMARVGRYRREFRPLPQNFEPPVLKGGTDWLGGSSRRDELYGDEGR